MTITGMILATLFWMGSLVLAAGIWFGTIMMTDAGGVDGLTDALVMALIIIASLYFVVTIGAMIAAWVAFALSRMTLARYAMFAPAVHIVLYIVVFILLGLRAPNWRMW